MVHLIVHIVREIKYCGPVFLHNMYPFERYMGVLKHYCRNWYRPEGSIVKGYTSEEVVGFSTDYLANQLPIGVPRSCHEGRLAGVGLMGLEISSPNSDMFDVAHLKALYHTSEVYPFVQQHKKILAKNFPKVSDEVIEEKHIATFSQWLQELLADRSMNSHLTWMARGPSHIVHKWQAYNINGNTLLIHLIRITDVV